LFLLFLQCIAISLAFVAVETLHLPVSSCAFQAITLRCAPAHLHQPVLRYHEHINNNRRSKTMQQLVTNPLQKALAEVHRGAHNQDLFEIPKQAELDREREARELLVPTPPQASK